MSPVLNCIPSNPPSEGTYPKGGSVASDGSNLEISASEKDLNGDLVECPNEDSCCENVSPDESRRVGLTNNNSIPLNYKKSPSPNEGITFEAPIRPWSSSPSFKSAERDQSVSPSSSGHRPSPCPPSRNSVSPDVSSENSRIPSHASSEAHEALASPDCFRTFKMSAADIPGDILLPFHENRLPSDGFRLSNTFVGDPINPYLRLSANPLNPFQTAPGFLGSPFLGAGDPKLLLNNSGLGLFTQQLHHLNGLSSNMSKIPPLDLQRMSMQQLQFLQSHLQSLPTLLHSSPYSKFPEHRNQLSMLIQARKHPKFDVEGIKTDAFTSTSPKPEEVSKLKDRRTKHMDAIKARKTSLQEGMEVGNYEDNNSDSDELLSVGSVSPPPNCQVALSRTETDTQNNAGLSGLNCSSFMFPNRTGNQSDSKKYSNNNGACRLQNSLAKPANAANRILKFSIDNILKSDFGSEEGVKKPKQTESKKEEERTSERRKNPEAEQETSVDLSQESTNSTSGTETPMLWPAWVYCTRYSDRPSSGPRTRRSKNKEKNPEEKRPRTAFSGDQLSRLKHEFAENRYLTERRRQDLARELGLNEAQIKIWFQNKRAKMKKARGEKNPLALQLMAQGLYNHSTVPLTKEEEEAAAAELSD